MTNEETPIEETEEFRKLLETEDIKTQPISDNSLSTQDVEVKSEEVPKENPPSSIKKEKKQIVKEYKENTNKKLDESDSGLKVVDKTKWTFLWVALSIAGLLVLIGIIVLGSSLGKISKKDFSDNINVNPNIQVNDSDNINNEYEHKIYINNTFTIQNNCSIPTINVEVNSS